ncbi:UDP-N-acetylmuramoyl-L-alanyl-D-glutamate--2,6-diaminopimelate ligase [Saccharothrix algeriensis]|uniref:UDP-N-acetylmuramoyl-L-alanyl-D-glutamate--2,6-diaminopimelate ligase n=1 Tax=Catellatospora bangladeshensis TaxID=310355 RepID=A0A8J3NH89_9ACTN|nr:UDP-N-acetylmuramoyl-L-alanyl-D-glutamate--2,6-diaminopimelate ligase [Catellatospora bangladeshensis]
MPGNHSSTSAPLRPARVTPVDLATLAALVGAQAPAGTAITGVTHAGDQARPGDLYAALPGARRHGAEFTAQALAGGAVAVLTDAAGAAHPGVAPAREAGVPVVVVADAREALGPVADAVYGSPTSAMTVIGLTGTAGKTSTAYLVESGLRAAGHVTGLIGTVETRLGDLVVNSVRTTPEATDLHAMLALARERGVTAVVMEVSSHALVMGRVGGVRFAVGGWTNFGSDHLDFHTDSDDYFQAKARLFDGRCAVEVLNLDDPALKPLLRPATVTYSAAGDPSATWHAEGVADQDFGQRFTAVGPPGRVAAGVRLPGLHNVANALLALACLTSVGVDAAVAAAGVAACPGVPGRLERVNAPGPVVGVVDYAHKVGAIEAALLALRQLADARGGRLIALLGAGGDRDTGKRPHMGAAGAHGSDLLIVTDDNPRTEDPALVRQGVLAGTAGAPAEVVEIAGRRGAIAEAVARAVPGDVIALLGKGHETGQEIQGEIHPFDDRIELAAALTARFGTAEGAGASANPADGTTRGDGPGPDAAVPQEEGR